MPLAGGKVDQERQEQKRVRETVDALLGAVSEDDRILLTLKEVEGLSLKELEKIYRVNENALKVRLFRARQRVLKAFGRAPGRRKERIRRKPVEDGRMFPVNEGNQGERLDTLFRAYRRCLRRP